MIRKCLFPAAGYGTRFLPATKSIPKEMLPIVNKPLIQYGVEEALAAGMDDIAIVTGRGKQAIEDLFDASPIIEESVRNTPKEALLSETNHLIANCRFSYTRQKTMRGLGDAILTGEPLIGDQPFAVVLADDLCTNTNGSDGVLTQMVEIYRRHECSIVAIEEVAPEQTDRYGVIAGKLIEEDLYQVTNMIEKPAPEEAPSNMAIIGRYILTPDIFDVLRTTPTGKGGELQITDALITQVKKGKVLAYKFKGRRFDCGSIHGFVQATNHFYAEFD